MGRPRKREETQGVTVRFPKELYTYLQRRAEKEHRYLNDEVLYLLELGIAEAEKVDAAVREVRNRSRDELKQALYAQEHEQHDENG
jgi:hypothetical protein